MQNLIKKMASLGIVVLLVSVFLPTSAFAVQATNFNLETISGNEVSLADFKGKEDVLVVFWATWCAYCVKKIPLLNELHEKLDNQGLEIVSINYKEPAKKVEKFVSKKDMKYTVLLDPKGSTADDYGVRALPALFFVSKDGEVTNLGSSLSEDKVRELMS